MLASLSMANGGRRQYVSW